METIKLRTRIGSDGMLKLETPTRFKDIETEILLVLQPAQDEPRDALGWPIGYFEQIDAIDADDVVERGDQGVFEERDLLE
jgi:hypothetical protein